MIIIGLQKYLLFSEMQKNYSEKLFLLKKEKYSIRTRIPLENSTPESARFSLFLRS